MAPTVVLVTGVSRHIGARVAARLAADSAIQRVIGVDTQPVHGTAASHRIEFVQADIRAPLIAEVISAAKVDTVVHTNVTGMPAGSQGRSLTKELNVIGTMQLLAACEQTPSIRKVVVRSATAVYGSGTRNPALLSETFEPAAGLRGYAKDAADVETYVRGFHRRRPDVHVTILRFANVLSPYVSTPLTRYFALTAPPTVLGFDPRLQFVHADDCVETLQAATVGEWPELVNVAGSGVLTLTQAIRRAGRLPLPLPRPLVSLLGSATSLDISSEQLAFLTHGRVVDTTRLRDELGYKLRFSTAQALDDLVHAHGLPSVLNPEFIGVLTRKAWANYLKLRR